MTQDERINRRAFMGTMAAATAGAVATPAAAESQDDDQQGSASSNHLAQYASPTGRVNTEGLDDAFVDWNNGNISGSRLDDVIDAWNTGRRVVSKTVVDLSGNIGSDRTLQKNPNNPGGEAVVYRVTGSITVSAQLTIEPGVVMEFQQGTRLTVGDGTLIAEGTAQEPIFVSATNATRGWWDGFHFITENLDNVMEYVTMEYGGGDRNGNVDVGSGFGNAGTLSMTNCTLRRSDEYGVSLGAGGELLDGSGENTYRYNRSGAAEARTSNVHTLSGDSSYIGNDYDFAFVNDASASGDGPDSEQRTWDALGVPYRMDGDHSVDEMSLDIQPGATFEFTQQSRLTFSENARLLLEGTANKPITFTGSDDQRGWWDGIYVTTTDIDNVMSHVTVEYGANGLSGNLEFGTGFGEDAEIAIDNCTFRQADGYGLYVGGSSVLKETADNTYTGNASGAARIRTNQAHYLSDTSSFTGNDNDWVLVSQATINGDGADAETRTWDAIEVPYRMDGTSSINNITLVIDHGGTFEFTEASRLTFNSGSRIDAVGFDDDAGVEGAVDEITFTGTDQQRGWWDGVFVKTSDIENVMEHVVIEYGGAGLDGNLEIGTGFGNSGELDLIECTLREGDGYGLYLGNGSAVRNAGGNTYTRNASGAARVKLPMVNQLSDTSTFTGNDNDWVLVDGRNVNENRVDNDPITWDAIDVPYRVNGNPAVNDVEVVIDPGAIFEFTESSGLDFNAGSVVTCQGREQDQITFTGTDQQRGWWDGIYVGTESVLNAMSHTIIEYGGDDLNGNLEISTGFGSVGSLEIQNCILRESGGYGLYVGSQGDLPNAEGNEYTANADGPARVKTSQVHYLSATSTFTGNDEDWVQVSSRNINSNRVTGPITWDAIDVPYRLGSTDSIHKVSDVELIVEPGVELQFEEQSQLWFASGSIINMQGEENNRIVCTATADSRTQIAGWWDGIYVSSDSILNTMDYVTVEYGGRALGGNLDLGTGFGDSASLTLTNSIIRNSSSAGVFYDPDDVSTSNWSGNTYSDNQGGDVIANN